jgi:hypothetical protein
MVRIDCLSDVVPLGVISILVGQSALHHEYLLTVIMDMQREGCSRGELGNKGGPSIVSIASLLEGDIVDVLD